MKIFQQQKGDQYIQPEAEVLLCAPEGVVCVSPGDGESEDVEYEDWG